MSNTASMHLPLMLKCKVALKNMTDDRNRKSIIFKMFYELNCPIAQDAFVVARNNEWNMSIKSLFLRMKVSLRQKLNCCC